MLTFTFSINIQNIFIKFSKNDILIASNIEINKEIPKWQKDEELLKSLLDL